MRYSIKYLALLLALLMPSVCYSFGVDKVGVVGHMSVTAPAQITFGSAVQSGYTTSASFTVPIALSGDVATGRRLVILWHSADATNPLITSVSDAKGNTWTVDRTYSAGGSNTLSIASSQITSGLVASDVITVTTGTVNGSVSGKVYQLCTITGMPSVDTPTAFTNAYAATVTMSAATTEARNILLGIIGAASSTATYSGGGWTAIDGGTPYIDNVLNGRRLYFVYKETASAGTQNPGGAWSASIAQRGLWGAYK